MTRSNQIIKGVRWLLNIAIFILIPVFLIYFGTRRINNLHKQQKLTSTEQKIQKMLNEFESYSETETFLAKSFWKTFYGSKQPLEDIKIFREQLDNRFDFLAWNNAGKIVESTRPVDHDKGDWPMLLASIERSFREKTPGYSAAEEENYKKILGPQFLPEMSRECRSDSNPYLMWPDVARRLPALWLAKSKYFSILIFVRPEVVRQKPGLDYFIKQNSQNDLSIGYIRNGKIHANRLIEESSAIKHHFRQNQSLNKREFSTAESRIYARVIADDLAIFICLKNQHIDSSIAVSPVAAALVFLLFMLPYLFLSFKIIVLQQKIKLSIRTKLGLLFLFSGGLPLAMLFFMGYDYLNQKETTLLDEIHDQATRYLQNFDERFESEHAHRIVLIQKALKQYLPTLKKDGIKPDSYFSLVENLVTDIDSLSEIQIFLIASRSKIIGTEKGIYYNKRIVDRKGIKSSKSDREAAKVYGALGKFVVDSVNGIPLDEKVSTEIELITESAMRKSIFELQQEFISANGKISLFGVGARKLPTYVNLISTSDDEKHDYMLLIYWDENSLERMYLKRQFLNANRNIQNLKIYASCEDSRDFFPIELVHQTGLRDYVNSFTTKPHPTRQFVEVNRQKHLIMGFKGKFMRNFNLFALYPAAEISEKIYHEKSMLVTAGLAAILIILVLAQIISKSFLFPLKIITEGAQAIKSKDFDMRLPELGRDEFGEIAQVFNETMVDLEELKVAGIVQEQLLPQKPPETGNFKLFGKSISMGDVGGDYFDYFNISADEFSVLIGDVSGHGVGAALIMAMAKAGILHSDNYLDRPVEVLNRLHRLIRSARTSGQNRYMCFQYMKLNGTNGKGSYANAGGWPPLVVKNNSIEELKLAGPFLGALKRPRFSELEFQLEPGDSLILYTDGIIEAKNFSGEMLGFEHFCKVVLEARNNDPEIFYNNIVSAYMPYANSSGHLSDDLTLLILIYDGQGFRSS